MPLDAGGNIGGHAGDRIAGIGDFDLQQIIRPGLDSIGQAVWRYAARSGTERSAQPLCARSAAATASSTSAAVPFGNLPMISSVAGLMDSIQL
jgi:hypothetical protein